MKKYYLYLTSVLVALMALTGCNKNIATVEAPEEGEMCFGLTPGSEFFDVNSTVTKATAATSIASFKCGVTQGSAGSETNASPCWNNITFTSDGAGTPTYTASPKKYWPLTNPSYNVYAVSATSGAAAAAATAAPDMTFAAAGTTISLAAGTDKDVICAYEPTGDITWKTKNTLAFEHIYARVSTVKVTAVAPCAISNITITIHNPKTGGTYNLRTGHGQTNGTGWSSLLPATGSKEIYRNSGSIASGSNNTGSNNDYYIVPGTYTLKATWTASVDDYSQTYTTMSSSSTISIQGGKINAIECNLSGDPTEVTFGVSISAWGSNTISGVNFNHS